MEINADVPQKFTRTVQRKNQQWEQDSRSRAEFDPESIPDCNVKANVGRDFLFHEVIHPKTEAERGYLRVPKSSLWWQQREFPWVWTTEGLSFCQEKGYIWSINSSMWNHMQALWQGNPLDLLRSIFKETKYQDLFCQCGEAISSRLEATTGQQTSVVGKS